MQTTIVPLKRNRVEGSQLGITSNFSGAHQIYQQHLQDHLKIFGTNTNTNNSANTSLQSSLYHGLPTAMHDYAGTPQQTSNHENFNSNNPALGSTMGFLLPNPAPDVAPLETEQKHVPTSFTSKLSMANNTGNFVYKAILKNILLYLVNLNFTVFFAEHSNNPMHLSEANLEPQKKKYAKEAWPGRKPMLGSL